ncbi:S8 family serine peptidase [Gallaecimonas sp. GXIMD4217]|uniref:S8 family serine peptidase n=1 Tax=Gallaecimonas sp. GXIMD4217 TaxID=3131927 RepID=UPI00311AF01B
MNKQQSLLAAAIAATLALPAVAAEPLPMVVEYKPGKADNLKAALAAHGIEVRRDLAAFNSLSLRLDRSQFKALAGLDGIAGLYPDVPRRLLAEGSASVEVSPYGIAMTQADQLDYLGGKKVCIVDTGFAYGHPDLPDATVDGAPDGGAGPWDQDGHGHGTHVAGTIAATGGNGIGVVGVNATGAMELHIVRVFDDGGGFAYASDLAGAVNDCVAGGADVISMSLGGALESRLEARAMDRAAKAGVLLIAAAGNDGNATHSYPASYDSVMSVAAVDGGGNHADFSQRTAQVEIAAPGVAVLSTVPEGMGSGGMAGVSQDGMGYEANAMEGSAFGDVTAPLADCGLGTESCGDVSGQICLIERGEISFADKVAQCQADGGVGAIVYNNAPGNFSGTLGGSSPLMAVSVSQADGLALLAKAGMDTSLTVAPMTDYGYMSGTSMATPHVSGVAALVWSHFPECGANDIRLALRASAQDLGEGGYDYRFGWGLVQAKDAYDYLMANGCKGGGGKIRGGDGSPR